MMRAGWQRWVCYLSLALSVLLLLLPLPDALRPLRPWWPALVLLYWVLEAPDRVGLGTAFITGLAADVLAGALLGDQALRLLVVVFLAQRFRARLRFSRCRSSPRRCCCCCSTTACCAG